MSVVAGMAMSLAVGFVGCSPQNTPDNGGGSNTTNLGDDDNDFVENQTWSNTVSINWGDSGVVIDGEVDGVNVTNTDGIVTVKSTAKYVEYALSGRGSGQLTVYSDYKFKLSLNGVVLMAQDGPAINNQCKKTCYVVLDGSNVLLDSRSYSDSEEDRKGAFFSEGQIVISGDGMLAAVGQVKHALASDDYIRIRGGEITLTSNVADGMHANDGIIIEGGSLKINAVGEGIQCDSSSIVIRDGVINVTNASDKGILAYGNILVSGGTVIVNSSGKGIKTHSDLEVQGGTVTVIAGGSNSGAYAPGRPGGNSSGVEGIEAKGKMTFTGGFVYAQASDDAINSGGDMVINGGYVCAYSTGNDGLDANGNCYIQGGLVYAIGSGSPEVAVDANSEAQKKLYVQGGTLIAIGGLENGASMTQSCYSASSWSSETWYQLTGDPLSLAFLTPQSAGTPLVVSSNSKPVLKSGVTVSDGNSIFNGMIMLGPSVSGGTDVTLSTYSGGQGGPGQGGGPGGWH